MGFWDELEDVLTNPSDHPFEATMIMAMTEEWEKDDDDLDFLYNDHHIHDLAEVKEERRLSLREKRLRSYSGYLNNVRKSWRKMRRWDQRRGSR